MGFASAFTPGRCTTIHPSYLRSLWTEPGRRSEVEDELGAFAERLGVEADSIGDTTLVTTPEQLSEHLRPYVDRGVGDFLLLARSAMSRRTLELFAGEVAPALRG